MVECWVGRPASDQDLCVLSYLSSFSDLLCFCIEVKISPQRFEQNFRLDAHPLAVDLGKLFDALKHTIRCHISAFTFVSQNTASPECFKMGLKSNFGDFEVKAAKKNSL